jgi:hypothetical protein
MRKLMRFLPVALAFIAAGNWWLHYFQTMYWTTFASAI